MFFVLVAAPVLFLNADQLPSIADLQAQITQLLAQITNLQAQLTALGKNGTGTIVPTFCYDFNNNLTVGQSEMASVPPSTRWVNS